MMKIPTYHLTFSPKIKMEKKKVVFNLRKIIILQIISTKKDMEGHPSSVFQVKWLFIVMTQMKTRQLGKKKNSDLRYIIGK